MKALSRKLEVEQLERRCLPSAAMVHHLVDHSARSAHFAPITPAVADVAVKIANNADPATFGGASVVCNVTVTNFGPATAVVTLDTTATGLKDQIWWGASNGHDLAAGVGDVHATFTLQPGQTAVFTLWSHVAISKGIAFNNATILTSGVIDPNLSNNTATTGIIVI